MYRCSVQKRTDQTRAPCTDGGSSSTEFRTHARTHSRASFEGRPPTSKTSGITLSPYRAPFTRTPLSAASPSRLAAA
eukprot:8548945-Lingulodinium_polyedra.AAC.1